MQKIKTRTDTAFQWLGRGGGGRKSLQVRSVMVGSCKCVEREAPPDPLFAELLLA